MADKDTKVEAFEAATSIVEAGGVTVAFDAAKLADARFIMMLGDLSDDSLPDSAKMAVQSRMFRFLFGADRERIMDELAEANGGTLSNVEFIAWWLEFIKVAGAKNS